MTNTSSSSISDRRIASMNNNNSTHLSLLSGGPTWRQYNTPTYSFSIASSLASGTRSQSLNSPNQAAFSSSSGTSSQSSLSNLNKQSNMLPSKPKLPNYLADTSFAELYNSVSTEAFALNGANNDKDPGELVALPTAWSADDKCNFLELSADKLSVSYAGTGKADTDAAAIRANYPIPPQCGVFYFEVDIINKGKEGFIGIGFCGKNVQLMRLPGWELQSWGYHGDDGNSFCCSGTGKTYGPKFTTGDTIGCCINFRDGTAFYTKGGVNLGIAFRDLKGILYPSIGLRTPGEKIQVNFGQRDFEFPIKLYMKEEKTRLWNFINAGPIPPLSTPSLGAVAAINSNNTNITSAFSTTPTPVSHAASEANLTATIHQLIMSYLVHHGFSETAKAFSKDAVQLSINDSIVTEGMEIEDSSSDIDGDMLNRQKIRHAVLKGDIDHAVRLTNIVYPKVLPSNHDIFFKLRCRKFVEMIANCSGYRQSPTKEVEVNKIVRADTIDTM
ncbi:2339_t:CDS:2 [Ambispora gerdemannii]|uniref:2339_t:CDS:1 n=1 Tax=Ambispora gerdemannii TaxID=144530 RepID=A0A9N8VV86_9GLOM|nr:2339_t:CDS:2 [Ambispora gerdemannii]